MRLTKGGASIDLLTAPYELLRELEVYAAAEGAAEKRRQARDRATARRGGRGRGRRHR